MKQCLRYISPQFNCQRMVPSTCTSCIVPAHRGYCEVRDSQFRTRAPRTTLERWVSTERLAQCKIRRTWSRPSSFCLEWIRYSDESRSRFGRINAGDVRVEAVVGRVGSTGQLEEAEVLTLPAVEHRGAAFVFRAAVCAAADRPFRVRVAHLSESRRQPADPAVQFSYKMGSGVVGKHFTGLRHSSVLFRWI